jgi:hypothetical protein
MILTILALMALLLCSCEGGRLITPTGVRVDSDTLTLKWNRISGARSYEVEIVGVYTQIVNSNSFSLEHLAPGSYQIRVKAMGDGDKIKDSQWADLNTPFVREEESGLKYKLINNKTAYQLVGSGYAEGDVVMESVYRNKPVISIADKALVGNKNITSFVVGENVTSIGDSAFARCAVLKQVILPNGLRHLGESAFQSCKKLKSIEIPDGVGQILPYTFSWCSELESLTMGNSVVSVGEFAFANCEMLTAVSLPASVKTIGEYAFSDCTKLVDLELGGNVEQIDAFAFCNCVGLSDVDFGGSLLSVGDESFKGCINLTSIILPDTCREIGSEAFRNCSNVSTVVLGIGLTSVGVKAFRDTALYEKSDTLVVAGGWILECKDNQITGLVGCDVLPGPGEVVMPEGITGIADYAFQECTELATANLKGVNYIGVFAFGYCKTLWEVVADDALKSIGDYAFAMCETLGDVTTGNSLEHIGNYAFYGCTPLNTVKLPETLTVIGMCAFDKTNAYNNNKRDPVIYVDKWAVGFNGEDRRVYTDIVIKSGTRGIANYAFYAAPVELSVEIPDSVAYIGKGAFYKCVALSSIRLPDSGILEIGDYAFYGCSQASFGENHVLNIPVGTIRIGRSAFYECTGIVGLTIPGSVVSIGDYAFYGCVNLGQSEIPIVDGDENCFIGDVVLEEGLVSLGSKAFCGCTGLVEIVLPDSLELMGERAFYKCENLRQVSLGASMESVPDYAFYGCTALESVTVKGNVETIGRYAFRGCLALENFDFNGVTDIGESAFFGCTGLQSFVGPQSLIRIGNYAFRGCAGMRSVILPDTIQVIGNHAFYGCTSATFFLENSSDPTTWNGRWNSAYRPVFRGVTLTEDKDQVQSITVGKDNPNNCDAVGGVGGPVKKGLVFVGWSTTLEGKVVYTPENVMEAPEGTVLYPKWERMPKS